MFERYVQTARLAIYFARAEALARQSPEITTADILIGLTHKLYEEPSPFMMLQHRSDELRTLVGLPPFEKAPEAKNIPLTRGSKIVLAYAAREAKHDRQFFLEPHHLLRGIVLGGDATAVALCGLGWNIEVLRDLSKKNRKLFPLERPPLIGLLKYHRRSILVSSGLLLIAVLILYLRWQQK